MLSLKDNYNHGVSRIMTDGVVLGIVFILLSYCSVEARSEKKNVQVFDLRSAIQFAIENSPVFDNLKNKVSISVLEEKIARSKLFPSLDLASKHGVLDSSPRGSTGPWSSEFSLDLTESLYDNGVSQTNLRIASLNKKMNEMIFEDQKNKFILDVLSQYLNYSLSVKGLEIQEKQYKLVIKQYEMISRDYYQGIKTKKDFLRFKTQVSRNEIELTSAKWNVEKFKQELIRIIGLNLNPEDEIGFSVISLESIKSNFSPKIKIEDHLQYRISEIQKTINNLNRDLIGRKKYPEWYLSAGASYSSSNYMGTGQTFSQNAQVGWNALLTLKYNFFDWGVRSNDAEIVARQMVIKNNEFDSTLLSLKSSISQLEANDRQVQKNFLLTKELLNLERENLDFIEKEYRNGKVQYLDLVTGLNNLSDAELKYYSAAANLETTRYSLLYHQGSLYEEIFK